MNLTLSNDELETAQNMIEYCLNHDLCMGMDLEGAEAAKRLLCKLNALICRQKPKL